MRSALSLRLRLLISYAGILLVALAVAATIGILTFDRLISEQAQRVVETNMSVASGLLDDTLSGLQASVDGVASDGTVGAAEDLGRQLQLSAQRADLSYLAYVTPDGTVAANSLSRDAFTTEWPQLTTWASAPSAARGIAIVPDDELSAIGMTSRTKVKVKETPNGTIVEGEDAGALALVAVTPFRNGVLVGVRVLTLDNTLVDSVVEKVGGTSTVFQNGVRIATTVRGADGDRAVGSVVSDEVRSVTLGGGEPFRGEAFVVDRKYLTAYEPLLDPAGSVVGMLYVGVDNAPFAAATRNFGIFFGVVCLLALGAGVVGAFAVSRTIARPLAAVGAAAGSVATGDLTVKVPSSGYREVKDLAGAFNSMTGGLRTIIDQVEASVAQLNAVSSEITAASRSSAEHATQQASSVAQTTATLEELTRSFQAVSEGARRVLVVAEDTLESAQEGANAVGRTHGAMDELAASARDMTSAADSMAGAATDINELTDVITAISGQTKILALNAAIEAARAGEAGRGFAVVSSEIRALAESVAESAQRITDVVGAIQDASGKLRASAGRQAALTQSTVELSDESRATFKSIVQQMEDTTLAAREIAEATTQQGRASDQLVQAMHQVSVSSNETAAAARQLAEAANAVEHEAEHMMGSLTRFKTH